MALKTRFRRVCSAAESSMVSSFVCCPSADATDRGFAYDRGGSRFSWLCTPAGERGKGFSPDGQARVGNHLSRAQTAKRPIVLKYLRFAFTDLCRKGIAMKRVIKPPEVLTLGEAARYLRISQETLKRLAAKGMIPGR